MRPLILLAVILQLVFTVDIKGYKFGDIIRFPRCKEKFTYAHFAIYVGDKTFPGKKDGEDIFERLKDKWPSKCVFSKLNVTDKPEVTNYLDGYKDTEGKVCQTGSEEEITTRIKAKFKKCGMYSLLNNNCEHLATYVRYGVKVALQVNMTGEGLCINDKQIDKKHLPQNVMKACPADRRTSG